ncbi:MAG: NAD(P)-binding protein [Oculatellaceae cyanobacterium Prado106]|jgi:phytoene dehydrogenase-like protein|nr:NAD(P)-binding protein [Oculatellaceae cyanobacterium Prado106]
MAAMTRSQKFDALVIGSGIGGLTVAALLAKLYRKRVLVLEQHFTAGGFTHAFERKGKFHWDVGLHYVGDMGEGDTGRALFDYLSDGQLQWQPMPTPFEKFVYPDFTCIPERLDQSWIGARTPIQNLYLTGTDAFSLGIMGAMMGGVKTAGMIKGAIGFFQIMSTVMQASKQQKKLSPELRPYTDKF